MALGHARQVLGLFREMRPCRQPALSFEVGFLSSFYFSQKTIVFWVLETVGLSVGVPVKGGTLFRASQLEELP